MSKSEDMFFHWVTMHPQTERQFFKEIYSQNKKYIKDWGCYPDDSVIFEGDNKHSELLRNKKKAKKELEEYQDYKRKLNK